MPVMSHTALPASPIAGLRTIELGAGCEPLLQRFFEANPLYFMTAHGEPARPNEAHEEIHDAMPAGWAFTKKWVIGYLDANDEVVALANVVTDVLSPGVWHIGTFIVATSRHGTGEAQVLHRGLDAWARANGARWLRLGVVVGNRRGERFWEQLGYVETRKREGVEMGKLTNTLRVMVKPLDDNTLDAYLARIERDRPDASATR